MKRKIDTLVSAAVAGCKSISLGNTVVKSEDRGTIIRVLLHGNEIATINRVSRQAYLNYFGFKTQVTKSRLNAVLDGLGIPERIQQKSFDWFLGDKPSSDNNLIRF